jgi:hypothetical protein
MGPAHVTRVHTSAYVSIRQHTSAYVSIRQRTYADIRVMEHGPCACHKFAYVSIRQHTSAYVSIRMQISVYFVAPVDLLDILSKGSNPQLIVRLNYL